MTQSNGEPEGGGQRNAVGGNDAPGEHSRQGSQHGLPGQKRLTRFAESASGAAGSAYQGAIEAAFAVVIATGIGYWADERFGTSPRWLIVGAIVGFGALVLRLARMGKLLQEPDQLDQESPGETARNESRAEDPDERE